MKINVDKKENVFFVIKVFFTLVILVCFIPIISLLTTKNESSTMAMITTIATYILIIVLFILFQKIYLIGYMKGNCIEISSNQFDDIYQGYKKMTQDVGIKKIPKLFIIQQGGALNAFAIRFSGNNYIAIYSDIFSLINDDIDTVRFVLGHELGHVARKHMSKRFWTCLSSIIPFLTAAYSRHCEYTCDQYGKKFSMTNYQNGLLVLAAGKDLYKQINIDSYINNADMNNTLSAKFIGICLSHPSTPKRIAKLTEK
jgi:Zn-dependent protease with chaperone function